MSQDVSIRSGNSAVNINISNFNLCNEHMCMNDSCEKGEFILFFVLLNTVNMKTIENRYR